MASSVLVYASLMISEVEPLFLPLRMLPPFFFFKLSFWLYISGQGHMQFLFIYLDCTAQLVRS